MFDVVMKFKGKFSDKVLVDVLKNDGFIYSPTLGEMTVTRQAVFQRFPTESEIIGIASSYQKTINESDAIKQYLIDLTFDGYQSVKQI